MDEAPGLRLVVAHQEFGEGELAKAHSGAQQRLFANENRPAFGAHLGALPVAAWLPHGDLVAATWMGTVVRFDAALKEQWRVNLADTTPPTALPPAVVPPPAARLLSWSNAAPTPLPLTPNLLARTIETVEG